ncbi:hypothetical protein [uncultured Chryseobacterium sp.]|uniref:hypothetical protein n=1 Tax=uncultured Chryseobacterium sp. TaxID=259322 RepID=UPI0025FD018A|nr:hypothetical protein [uncultured Chryseobacterium sp.]
MNIEQANAIPLREILQKIECYAVKEKDEFIFYNSPLHQDEGANFIVNTRKNRWQDISVAKYGNVVDFICLYLLSKDEDHTVIDALRWIRNMTRSKPVLNTAVKSKSLPVNLVVQSVSDLEDIDLITFLKEKYIPSEVARKYLKQIIIKNKDNGKTFIALGMENENESFEVLNEVIGGSIGVRGISFVRGSQLPSTEVNIFEDMLDFLSAVSYQPKYEFKGDSIILNSMLCMPQMFAYINTYPYQQLSTWLDNSSCGESATQFLKNVVRQENDMRFQAMNHIYRKHNNYHEWHIENMMK